MYAFDLLLFIYEEAWYDEASPEAEITGRRLRDDFAELEHLQAELPGLILAYNLHGIDIDPRAAQIAALALWMRGQRACNEFQITRERRPLIQKSNIVCAEPMPGEASFLDEIIAEHFEDDSEGRFLANLVRKVFEAMKLAGEAGSLLKIEEDIAEEVRKVKKQWLKRPEYKQRTLFDEGLRTMHQELDLISGITETSFWAEAEQSIYDALRVYAEKAERNTKFQRRLFAIDAARGFAFIDLCRQRYEVVLMNPPFGKGTKPSDKYLRRSFPDNWKDVYACFIERACHELLSCGFVGCISSSLFLYTKQLRQLRQSWLTRRSLSVLVELGQGVMDDAAVASALTVTSAQPQQITTFVDLVDCDDNEAYLHNEIRQPQQRTTLRRLSDFSHIFGNPFCYHVSEQKLRLWRHSELVQPDYVYMAAGSQAVDGFRFARQRWEIPLDKLNVRWFGYEKGGDYQPYLSPTKLVYNWKNQGTEVRAFQFLKYDTDAQVRQSIDWWWKPGITYPRVSSIGFGPRAMPRGHIFSGDSISLFCHKTNVRSPLLAFLASSWGQELIETFGRYRKIEVRAVANVPLPESAFLGSNVALERLSTRAIRLIAQLESFDETSPIFLFPELPISMSEPEALSFQGAERGAIRSELEVLCDEVDDVSAQILFGDNQPELTVTRRRDLVPRICSVDESSEVKCLTNWLSYCLGVVFGRWDVSLIVTGNRATAFENFDPYAALPNRPLGMNQGYADDASELVVDDVGHKQDILAVLSDAACSVFGESATEFLRKSADTLLGLKGHRELRNWWAKSGFEDHLHRYSDSRGRVPIYWQLATPTASYSLWLYYHRLTRDTFFKVKDIIRDKVVHEQRKLNRLQSEGGGEPSRAQRKEIEDQEKFVAEMMAMVEEVERIAPLWNPNLNDGVIINFAPLWRLVPQNRSWQKECKKV